MIRRAFATLVLLLALTGAASAAPEAATPGRRVAMVVGNGLYRNVPALPNAGNDARLIADTLRAQGFELVGGDVLLDLDRARLGAAVQAFGRALAGAEIGLFYYAGHGLQVRGVNWLVPVDANPARPQDLDFQMVDADLVLRQMEAAGTRLNLLLLDACRNNPFLSTGLRATGSGLAEMRAPEGTLISYATQPGAVASDGPAGGNGPYAAALAGAMRASETDIFRLFNQVGLQVKRSTGGAQQPWVSNSPIEGDLRFGRPMLTAMAPPATPTLPIAPPPPADTPPTEAWRAALAATRCSLLLVQDDATGPRITGFTPPGIDMAALLRQLGLSPPGSPAATRGVRVVEGEVRALPAFACPVVEMLAPVIRASCGLVLATGSSRTVPQNQPFPVGLAPAQAYLVDVFQGDSVQHLVARPVNGRLTIPAGALATPGPRLVTAVASAAPLGLGARPDTEPANAYLQALRAALATAGPVEAAILLLQVQPAAPRPAVATGAPRPPPQGPGCARVLERAQLGDTLSDADRQTLRGCR